MVIAINGPPSADSTAKLEDLISQYAHSELIIIGDFNLDWLFNASEHLKELCNNLNISHLITDPTRPNPKDHNRSTLIYFILTSRSNKIVATGVFDLGISDH